MKKLHLFLGLVLFLFINACGNKPAGESNATTKVVTKRVELERGWIYRDTTEYSIKYPADWKFQSIGQIGIQFIVTSMPTCETDSFRENINLVVEDLLGTDLTLDKYASMSEEQIKELVYNVKILKSERVKTESDEYQCIVYEGEQGKNKLTFEQYYRVSNMKAYVLTFTAGRNEYADYREIAEKIMNSFQIK